MLASVPCAHDQPGQATWRSPIAGVGVEVFRGSPQSGEILATGASPGFRLFVASGDDAALNFAKALVNGS